MKSLARYFYKIRSFLPNIKRNKLYNFIKSLLVYDENEKNILRALEFVKLNDLEGDYAEFGVYNGESFIIACYFSKFFKLKNMKFYAFDSFEGLPSPEKEDLGFYWKEGDCNCSLEKFKSNLKKAKVDLNGVVSIKGWYNETLKKGKKYGIKKLAFIHVDCDYYSSTKLVFEYIKPFLQEGTVILFDDWYCYNASAEEGEQKAFGEFLKKNKHISFIDFPAEGLKKMFICQKIGKKYA
ncbi:MAG: TylF/MycF/NovP-related O-methyltransferase [Candidatus Diapherotrites archaeon]